MMLGYATRRAAVRTLKGVTISVAIMAATVIFAYYSKDENVAKIAAIVGVILLVPAAIFRWHSESKKTTDDLTGESGENYSER
jgi:hypothetical protein